MTLEVPVAWLEWIDALWLPAGLILVHQRQRIYAALFVLCGMLLLRLQVELMDSLGYPNGLIGLIDWPVLKRGLCVYSAFYILYFLLAFYSPHTSRVIILAATLSLLFSALFVSMMVMIL